ncbi:MAG: type II toxin-antitoxin system Phd/YefM family antitoxin [Bryobacteraceae bacterium]
MKSDRRNVKWYGQPRQRANTALISEEDWRAIQETLYLLSIPGMRESIRKGMATPIDACAKEIRW